MEPPTCRSRSKSAHKCIPYNRCEILSRSIEIWQYTSTKNLVWSKKNSTYMFRCQYSTSCVGPWEAATICPRPCKLTFDLMTMKVESRVTRATSVPILVFLGLSVLDLDNADVCDRQTDVRRAPSLNAPPGSIIIIYPTITIHNCDK